MSREDFYGVGAVLGIVVFFALVLFGLPWLETVLHINAQKARLFKAEQIYVLQQEDTP